MNEQTGGAGRRDDTQDQAQAAQPPQAAQQGDGAEAGAAAGSADAQGAAEEPGRIGESPRQGQGGYGNDTGFTGGTQGATDDAPPGSDQVGIQRGQESGAERDTTSRDTREGGMR